MASVDLDALLQPVSEEAPAGENVEYDLAFAELSRTASWSEERQVGDQVIEAEAPAWRDVRDQALALFERTRDLQVAVYLAQALTGLEGIAGFETGVRLIAQLLEQFWDSVHPALDPDDGYDPFPRVSRLAALGDRDTTLRIIRAAVVVESRSVGRFSVRDLLLADGLVKPVQEEGTPDRALLDAALHDAGSEYAATMLESVVSIIGALQSISATFEERSAGAESGPELDGLHAVFACVRSFYEKLVTSATEGEAGGDASDTMPGDAADGAAIGSATTAVGSLRSRQDVKRVLAQCCEWLRKNEPGHPAPLLIERGGRLLDMDFMEIMRDLAPGGLPEVEKIAGVQSEQSSYE